MSYPKTRLGTYYRAQILKHFGIWANGNRVLDVGGYDGYWLSTQKAKNKYVLDLAIKKKYKNIRYFKGSALKIPFESNYFDQVYSFDVLEHIDGGHEQQFINELVRVCKKNGEIILSTPSKAIKMFPGFMTNYISRKWGHFKCNGYSKKDLTKFLSKYEGIRYQIVENNALFYRLFYLPVRLCWTMFPKLTTKMVNIISVNDSKRKSGDNGFYIVKIYKDG